MVGICSGEVEMDDHHASQRLSTAEQVDMCIRKGTHLCALPSPEWSWDIRRFHYGAKSVWSALGMPTLLVL
eukprot:4094-Eustigmatos_ZCMA.PRE.1